MKENTSVTVGDVRKAIEKEKLLWLPDKNLKDSDPLPLFPTGGTLEETSSDSKIANPDKIIEEYPPANPFLYEKLKELKKQNK